jgi:hypothetical protein
MSDTRKGKEKPSYLPVIQWKDKQQLNTYPNVLTAAKKLSIQPTNISAVLNNKRPSAGGFYWTYKK